MAEQPTQLKPLIQRVVDGHELSVLEAATALDVIMTGGATPAQIGSLLTALRMRGETAGEIAGFARTMRKHALRVELADDPRPAIDTCGTGGDGRGTFNISTTAAFVVAGAGVRVAKHGNRSMTSKCGSADVLEGLGYNIQLRPDEVAESVERTGFGFMFAQAFHPAMKYVAPIRRELGFRTVFNVLGPLTNPAGVRRQIVGVSDRRLQPLLADVLALLGAERVLFVSSHDGLDEISLSGPTDVVEFEREQAHATHYTLDPSTMGFDLATREAVLGGSVEENVAITRSVLAGEAGPKRDVTLLNAGAAIYAAGVATSIEHGIQCAAVSIDSGRAKDVLDHAVQVSQDAIARRADR
ncbi:MAG: anthranilate phosphoribosyltransferase [Thermomicrobiales bacterium]|nr:anthranilate phosphoribosyltransferase [Thermomicrobiales bacterium]